MARHRSEFEGHQNSEQQSAVSLSRRIHVLIDKDITAKMAVTIWEHEKPIIEALFGEGNVKDVAKASLDEGYSPVMRPDMLIYNKTQDKIARPSESQCLNYVFIGDAQAEYDRLAKAYGRLPEEKRDTVEVIYGRFQEGRFSRLLGRPRLEDLPDSQLRGLIFDYGYAPLPHKDAGAAEKDAVFKLRKELQEAGRDQLIKIAQEVGVQIG